MEARFLHLASQGADRTRTPSALPLDMPVFPGILQDSFTNPCINLLVPPSGTREYNPKVLELVHLLQCIAAYLVSWRDNTTSFQCWFSFRPRRTQPQTDRVHAKDLLQKMLAAPNHPQKANGWSCCFQQWPGSHKQKRPDQPLKKPNSTEKSQITINAQRHL